MNVSQNVLMSSVLVGKQIKQIQNELEFIGYVLVNIDDFVQCVPTKKGHQILFKGYTYVFKSRLQCGAEQWCCSYRQKTETKLPETLPDWISIYFVQSPDLLTEYRCNICDDLISVDLDPLAQLEHVKDKHKQVYDLHKENPEASVRFRILLTEPVILSQPECDTQHEIGESLIGEKTDDSVNVEYVLLSDKKKEKKKRTRLESSEGRKRSWVWKYFDQLSSIIFRCTICNVVLSIKGSNTNNMNRHVRARHPEIYQSETSLKDECTESLADLLIESEETPYAIKTEEISASERILEDSLDSSMMRQRRSWVWSYFKRVTDSQAICKLCNRSIVHGGVNTGNMNRHMKMIHRDIYADLVPDHFKKTPDDKSWIWKVFGTEDDDYYVCKICQHRVQKLADVIKSVSSILQHLKTEHGVISGDQIITDASI